MSAFLGPIHHLMYRKIERQEALTKQMINLAEEKGWSENLQSRMDEKFGKFEALPLEEIIDQKNIHGWLEARIIRAEDKMAAAGKEILAEDGSRLKEIEALFFSLGKKHPVQGKDAQEIYRELDAFLLDGMPCDRGRYTLTEGTEDEVTWGYQAGKHSFCQPLDGIENPFAKLREAILRGMLENSDFELEHLEGTEYKIIRKSA